MKATGNTGGEHQLEQHLPPPPTKPKGGVRAAAAAAKAETKTPKPTTGRQSRASEREREREGAAIKNRTHFSSYTYVRQKNHGGIRGFHEGFRPLRVSDQGREVPLLAGCARRLGVRASCGAHVHLEQPLRPGMPPLHLRARGGPDLRPPRRMQLHRLRTLRRGSWR